MTTVKYLNNEGVVSEFFSNNYQNGYAYGENNSNVFFNGKKLYSYGTHFVLAQLLPDGTYLVNADSYSSSTAKHQAYVQSYVPKNRKVEIPFSALERAGINPDWIEIIDVEGSRLINVMRKVEGESELVPTHLMGATLFKHMGKFYLSGIDETAKNLWRGFFLTHLVGEPTSVQEAYECMKPEVVRNAEKRGEEVLRQGEYFFLDVDAEMLDKLKAMEKAKDVLVKEPLQHKAHDEGRTSWEFQNSRHVVTRYVKIGDVQFAKGTCRHVAGEHRMLKLGTWKEVVENIQVKSFSSNGRVD